MTSIDKIYAELLRKKKFPYYDMLQCVVKHLEKDPKTQVYSVINTKHFIEKVRNELEKNNVTNKKLTGTNLNRTLAIALNQSELEEGYGKDYFRSGRTESFAIYHLRTSTVLPALKKSK